MRSIVSVDGNAGETPAQRIPIRLLRSSSIRTNPVGPIAPLHFCRKERDNARQIRNTVKSAEHPVTNKIEFVCDTLPSTDEK